MASMRDLHTFLNFSYCEKFTIQVLFDNSERATSQCVQHVQLASHHSLSPYNNYLRTTMNGTWESTRNETSAGGKQL